MSLFANQVLFETRGSYFMKKSFQAETDQKSSNDLKEQTKTLTDQEGPLMQLIINNNIIIADLQKIFQDEFPYLKLEFFKTSESGKPYTTIKKFCLPEKSFGKQLKLKKEGEITIDSTMTVADLVEQFCKKFGIHVQIFRKSGNLWMEVTLTTGWTLAQQNHHAKEISI